MRPTTRYIVPVVGFLAFMVHLHSPMTLHSMKYERYSTSAASKHAK